MIYEYEGKTEKEAIEKAASELGLERDQFDVEILETQKNSLFKKGYVKIRVNPVDSPDASHAGNDNRMYETPARIVADPLPQDEFEKKLLEFVDTIIEKMGYDVKTEIVFREVRKIGIKMNSQNSSILIGRKGKNLDALQLLANIYAGRLGNEDIKVILASGRPDFGMMKIVEDLKLDSYDNYLLSYNGARIANLKTGEVVYEKFLSPERIKFLIDIALENDCDILTYQNGDVLTNRDNEYARVEVGLVGAKLIIAENMKEHIKEGAAKVIILKHPDEAQAVKEKLQKELGDEYEVATSKPFFIEVNDKGISKGDSLDALCKKLGLTKDNVMALGDGLNDLSMIEFAGMGVAVDNANPVLKEAANFISKSNDEDGFAYAIEKFILNNEN